MQNATTTNLKYEVIKTRECGLEVYRLLVWVDGTLSLIKTFMSEGGARTAYREYAQKVGAM